MTQKRYKLVQGMRQISAKNEGAILYAAHTQPFARYLSEKLYGILW